MTHDLIGSAAAILVYGVPFVAAAVWARRRFGRWALVSLWLVGSAAVGLLHAAMAASGAPPIAPVPPPPLAAMGLLRFFVSLVGFGAASLAVDRAARRGAPSAPWPDFFLPLVSFAVGHLLANAAAFAVMVTRMDRIVP
jgi:hypothetical protein